MLQPITLQDIDLAVEIEQFCFPDPWKREHLLKELKKEGLSHPCFYVDESDGKIKGYAIVWTIFEQADLVRFCILPSYRRQGYAKQFLHELIEEARAQGCEIMRLEVSEHNKPALALYKKLGFVETRKRLDYYGQGENSLEMVLGF